MPIDSQGDLENGEELTNEDLTNNKDQLLESVTAQEELQASEDSATAAPVVGETPFFILWEITITKSNKGIVKNKSIGLRKEV